MTYTFQTDARGVVTISPDGGSSWETPVMSEGNQARFRTNIASRWASVVEDECPALIPKSWVLAIIGHESALTGDEQLIQYGASHDPATIMASSAIGVGLMQLSNIAFKRNHTLSQLQNGRTNIRIGCEHLKYLVQLMGPSCQLPHVCSMWNAGADANRKRPWPSTVSPFGMRESQGYILSVLRMNNGYLLGPGNVGNPGPIQGPINVAGVAGKAGILAAGLLALGVAWPYLTHSKGFSL